MSARSSRPRSAGARCCCGWRTPVSVRLVEADRFHDLPDLVREEAAGVLRLGLDEQPTTATSSSLAAITHGPPFVRSPTPEVAYARHSGVAYGLSLHGTELVMTGPVELTTLTDGGQPAARVASRDRGVRPATRARASTSRSTTSASRRRPARSSSHRCSRRSSAAFACGSSTTSTTPGRSPSRRRRRRGRRRSRRSRSRRAGSPGSPTSCTTSSASATAATYGPGR